MVPLAHHLECANCPDTSTLIETQTDLCAQVQDVCTTGQEHIVVSYSRRTFLQTGDGHFSPIGGYHAGKDLVLILDVVGAAISLSLSWIHLPQG